MNPNPVSRFPIPDLADLPQDIRERIAEVQDKAGFVPNIFLALARRPDEFRAFFTYHDALMEKETPGLSKAEREMIVVATSARNQCQYCVIAHGAILRIRARNPQIADQLATNYRKADIGAAKSHARLRAQGVARGGDDATQTISASISTISTTRISGTSVRSARSSACPTASSTCRACAPTTSFT